MPETYDEIIEEIEQLDECCDNYNRYLLNHGLRKRHLWASTDMALDIADRVREAVGGDPREWWVLDADGNRVCIGDLVKNDFNDTFPVVGLGIIGDRKTVKYCDGYDFADTVHKVIPDTREKIIEDTLEKLDQTEMYRTSLVVESVEQAIDRAMKLAEVDA